MAFQVRNRQGAALDFRIFIPVDHFDQGGFKLGELCEMTTADDTTVGYGLAWRDTDKMTQPRVKAVKTTETLRHAYGIKEGDLINFNRTNARIVHAKSVTLRDCTRDESNNVADSKWRIRCESALSKATAILPQDIADSFSPVRGVDRRHGLQRYCEERW